MLPHTLLRRLTGLSRTEKILLMLGADCLALPACAQLALRPQASTGSALAATLPLTLLLASMTVSTLAAADLYRAAVRQLESQSLLWASGALSAAVLCVHLLSLPYAAPVRLLAYWLLAGAWLAGSRLAMRGLLRRPHGAAGERPAAAIYGGGDQGALAAHTLRASRYRPVCIFDEQHGSRIAGLPVLPPEQLPALAASDALRLLVLATPEIGAARLRAIVGQARAAGVAVRRLRALDEPDRPGTQPEFAPEQLLGRAPVPPDPALFSRCVRGRSVLVTGAGGSIGSELCRQIASQSPRRLHLLDHCEYALYTVRQELERRWPDLDLRAHLGSACSDTVLDRVLAGGVDTIYHAAAYKHVGLVDANPAEGLRNNVLGARAVSAAAARHGVATCVLVSSDKAVRPTTIMGASKRLSELLFLAAAAGATRTVYSMVRFGNVLGSSGSVLPLFRRQLAEGGPLTITHPGMERYFMLIPEAAQLVIQAGAMAEGGEVFVLDMGQPVRILDLARRMMALAGLSERDGRHPDGDIEIRYVGLAPGEKLREELLACGQAEASHHPRIRRMKEAAPDAAALEQSLIRLLRACDGGQRGRIESVLRTIMADFRPPGAAAPAAIPAPRAQATESAAVPSS